MTRFPILEEIRRVRHEISAEHDHDPKKMLAYYSKIQEQFRDRMVNYGQMSDAALQACDGEHTSNVLADQLFQALDAEEANRHSPQSE